MVTPGLSSMVGGKKKSIVVPGLEILRLNSVGKTGASTPHDLSPEGQAVTGGAYSELQSRDGNIASMNWRIAAGAVVCPWNQDYVVAAGEDFTFEGWFMFENVDSSAAMMRGNGSLGPAWILSGTGTKMYVPDFDTEDNAHTVSLPGTLVWFNMAAIRKDGDINIHLNKNPTPISTLPNTQAITFPTAIDSSFGGDESMWCDTIAVRIGHAKTMAELY